MCWSCLCFFFFKQKTAYEMRISDWSSDVCSSDLVGAPVRSISRRAIGRGGKRANCSECRAPRRSLQPPCHAARPAQADETARGDALARARLELRWRTSSPWQSLISIFVDMRSEAHTSELQSLIRISYAASCLK